MVQKRSGSGSGPKGKSSSSSPGSGTSTSSSATKYSSHSAKLQNVRGLKSHLKLNELRLNIKEKMKNSMKNKKEYM